MTNNYSYSGQSTTSAYNVLNESSSEDEDESSDKSIHTDPKTDWRSIYVAMSLTFVCSVQFSLYLSSLWPFLNIIDTSADEKFFGYIVAAYSLGQMIFSPIQGYWSNKIKQIRIPLYFGLLLCFIGNAIYLSIELWPEHIHRKYILLIGRFITGLGSSNISLLKAYASTASTFQDRSKAVAFVTGGVALGMTCGPGFQLIFSPIKYPGWIIGGGLSISMYTAPAIMACVINLLGAISVKFFFKETYAGLVDESSTNNGQQTTLPNYDKIAAVNCYFTRFAQMFIQTNLETIGTPFAMAIFAFTKHQVVFYTSLAQGIMGFLSFVTYATYIKFNLSRFINQRILSVATIVFLIIFHILTYSWPFLPGHLKTINNTDAGNATDDELGGCNTDKLSWCNSVKPVNVWLYYVSYIIIIGTAFPYLNISLNTIFSKVIGPRRQGTQQGILQMSGSAARMIGPLIISVVYTDYGPRWAWNIEFISLGICLIMWIIFYRRMIALKIPKIDLITTETDGNSNGIANINYNDETNE